MHATTTTTIKNIDTSKQIVKENQGPSLEIDEVTSKKNQLNNNSNNNYSPSDKYTSTEKITSDHTTNGTILRPEPEAYGIEKEIELKETKEMMIKASKQTKSVVDSRIGVNDDAHLGVDVKNNNDVEAQPLVARDIVLNSIQQLPDHTRSWHLEILFGLFLSSDEKEMSNLAKRSKQNKQPFFSLHLVDYLK